MAMEGDARQTERRGTEPYLTKTFERRPVGGMYRSMARAVPLAGAAAAERGTGDLAFCPVGGLSRRVQCDRPQGTSVPPPAPAPSLKRPLVNAIIIFVHSRLLTVSCILVKIKSEAGSDGNWPNWTTQSLSSCQDIHVVADNPIVISPAHLQHLSIMAEELDLGTILILKVSSLYLVVQDWECTIPGLFKIGSVPSQGCSRLGVYHPRVVQDWECTIPWLFKVGSVPSQGCSRLGVYHPRVVQDWECTIPGLFKIRSVPSQCRSVSTDILSIGPNKESQSFPILLLEEITFLFLTES
ncbi:hypothetical protein J6590_024890 [Homalodisca vitripennis]|nr:hypothetical protein J6590_024890 [Homalodisca vitripennis]